MLILAHCSQHSQLLTLGEGICVGVIIIKIITTVLVPIIHTRCCVLYIFNITTVILVSNMETMKHKRINKSPKEASNWWADAKTHILLGLQDGWWPCYLAHVKQLTLRKRKAAPKSLGLVAGTLRGALMVGDAGEHPELGSRVLPLSINKLTEHQDQTRSLCYYNEMGPNIP